LFGTAWLGNENCSNDDRVITANSFGFAAVCFTFNVGAVITVTLNEALFFFFFGR